MTTTAVIFLAIIFVAATDHLSEKIDALNDTIKRMMEELRNK